jgi:hypothetical protein
VHFMFGGHHKDPSAPKLNLRLPWTWNALATREYCHMLKLVLVVGIIQGLTDHKLRLMGIASGPIFITNTFFL